MESWYKGVRAFIFRTGVPRHRWRASQGPAQQAKKRLGKMGFA